MKYYSKFTIETPDNLVEVELSHVGHAKIMDLLLKLKEEDDCIKRTRGSV